MDIQIEKFSGPYDLLLQLIQDKKLSISEISLAEVTQQYLAFLEDVKDDRADKIADFLVVAAKLLLLKAKGLLPDMLDEEDDGPRLEDQLRLYEAFIKASKYLQEKWMDPQFSVGRIEPKKFVKPEHPPENISVAKLEAVMLHLLSRLRPPNPLPSTHIDSAVSLKEKILHISKLLKAKSKFSFNDIISQSANKTEVIVGFLAVLELMKQHAVVVKQTELFGSVTIHRIS